MPLTAGNPQPGLLVRLPAATGARPIFLVPLALYQAQILAIIYAMVLRAWIGLNAADASLTWLSFTLGAAEGNFILSLLADSLGPAGMLFIKVLFAVAVGGILWNRSAFHLFGALNWAMVGIVTYNLLIISYVL